MSCVLCGSTTTADGGVFQCPNCRREGTLIERQLALWSYEQPIEAVVHGLKFKKMDFLGSQLAAALHRSFADVLSEVNVVVPIPLHWYRRLDRGFNQVEAIALPLSRSLKVPMLRALRRRRFTRAQARLDRADRLRNLERVLVADSRARSALRDQHVLLLDDVVTTGATLAAAARALSPCKVRTITTMTVAATPLGRRREPRK
ncbi:MAG: phosphoribosyltransferase family protein [Acidobacteriota bacterium]